MWTKLSKSAHLNNYIQVFHKFLFGVNQFTDVLLSFYLSVWHDQCRACRSCHINTRLISVHAGK